MRTATGVNACFDCCVPARQNQTILYYVHPHYYGCKELSERLVVRTVTRLRKMLASSSSLLQRPQAVLGKQQSARPKPHAVSSVRCQAEKGNESSYSQIRDKAAVLMSGLAASCLVSHFRGHMPCIWRHPGRLYSGLQRQSRPKRSQCS